MTNFMILVIIFHALFYAGNCCLIFRLCANDVRSSVLQEMLLPWLNNTVGNTGYNYLKHESMIRLANGSEIWIGGLGDKEPADKILGDEYDTMHRGDRWYKPQNLIAVMDGKPPEKDDT